MAILNHNKPSAYLVPSALYESMIDIIDDYHLAQQARERLDYNEDDMIEVSIDDL